MILLSGHNLTPARKVPLEAMSLQLNERNSSATITPADMTGIQVNSWMQDDTAPGNGIVWRVKSIGQAFATNTPTVQLEHAITTLKDTILFGEIKPAQITGNPKATTCTAEQAVRFILSKQSDWILGSFGYAVSNPYKFDGDSLFDALETVSASLQEAWWSYDFSSYPFRLNINMGTSREETEMRTGRNLKTISRTIDKSGMFTRFYPIGKDDLHLDSRYVDMHVAQYGVIEKVETDNEIDTQAELRRWATERLAFHSEPTVTIDVDGLELADATGESLDRMQLGAFCRIPLPEYGTTISERIVTLNYPDKIHQPEVVKITLANNRENATKIIQDAIKKGGKGARTSSKKGKEDRAWFEDTNDHVAMCAKGIVGVDANGNPNWVRLSQIIVNENGIETSVRSVQKGLEIASTKITQNENAITLEARRATEKENVLSGQISVEAGKINQVVTAVGKDGVVTAASICLAINESGESSATINASKIYLLGQTIANQINADYIATKVAAIPQLNANNILASGVKVVVGQTQSDVATQVYVSGCPYDLQIVQSGNTYTLQQKRLGYEATWQDVGSFNSAGAVTLKNPVWTTPASSSPSGYSNSVKIETDGKPVESSKTVVVTLTDTAWSSGSKTVYCCHTDTSADNRVAKWSVSIPNPTNLSNITTYGNSPPSGGYSYGTLSKGGLTVGKYMYMTARVGGKTFTFYFYVGA